MIIKAVEDELNRLTFPNPQQRELLRAALTARYRRANPEAFKKLIIKHQKTQMPTSGGGIDFASACNAQGQQH